MSRSNALAVLIKSSEWLPSGSSFILCLPFTASHTPEQLHQVPNLDVFKRAHRVLDLPAQPFVSAAGDKPIELLDRVFPCERMGGEAGKILNLMLDHFAVL